MVINLRHIATACSYTNIIDENRPGIFNDFNEMSVQYAFMLILDKTPYTKAFNHLFFFV